MKIVWAVDAYAANRLQASAARLARVLAENSPCRVEPVYVMSPPPKSPIADAVKSDQLLEIRRVEDILERKFKDYADIGLAPFKILAHDSRSVRGAVEALLSYALSQKADGILISTGSRRGLARFFMGSFAETLVLQSSIPTFVVKPSSKIERGLSPILLATDFTEPSWKAFQSVVKLAGLTQSRVVIFHQFLSEESAIPSNVLKKKGGRWESAGSEWAKGEQLANLKEAERWKNWALSKRVRCETLFHYGVCHVADATLLAAEEVGARMIALAAIRGPNEYSIVGRAPRWILRTADCPVWIVHVPGKS